MTELRSNDENMRDGSVRNPAVLAGLIGGAVFMTAEMLMAMILSHSPWAPPRMIAAIVLGSSVLQPTEFDVGVLITAMMIHFPLSIVYGVIIGRIVGNLSMSRAILIGTVIGLMIYVVDFYGIASVVFEWFATARNWVSLVTHLLFGLVTAWSYIALARQSSGTAVA